MVVTVMQPVLHLQGWLRILIGEISTWLLPCTVLWSEPGDEASISSTVYMLLSSIYYGHTQSVTFLPFRHSVLISVNRHCRWKCGAVNTLLYSVDASDHSNRLFILTLCVDCSEGHTYMYFNSCFVGSASHIFSIMKKRVLSSACKRLNDTWHSAHV